MMLVLVLGHDGKSRTLVLIKKLNLVHSEPLPEDVAKELSPRFHF